jgi:hypothetical protein
MLSRRRPVCNYLIVRRSALLCDHFNNLNLEIQGCGNSLQVGELDIHALFGVANDCSIGSVASFACSSLGGR